MKKGVLRGIVFLFVEGCCKKRKLLPEVLILGIFAVWLGCVPLSRAVDTFYVSVYNQYGSGGGDAILKITNVDGAPVVTTFASGFTQPEGIAFDASGNLYVVDLSTIYKYTPEGVQSIFVSDPSRINGQPTTGLFIDSHGNVWVPGDGKTSYASIIEYDPFGVEVKTVVTYGGPSGFVVDAEGNLYVANSGNGNIVKYAPDGSSTTLVEDTHLYSAAGLVFAPDGTLLVACGNKIYKVQDGALVLYASLSATGGGMVFDSEGNLLTALEGGGSKNGIAITTPNGTTTTYLSLTKYDFPNTLAIAPAIIPEPGTNLLLLSGLLVLWLFCFRLKCDRKWVVIACNHKRLQ